MNNILALAALLSSAPAGAAETPSYEAARRVLAEGASPVFDGAATRPSLAVAALPSGQTAPLFQAPAREKVLRPEPPPPGGAGRVMGRISETALRWLSASFFGVLGAALAIGVALLVPGAGLWAPALIGFAVGSLVGLLALKSKKKN